MSVAVFPVSSPIFPVSSPIGGPTVTAGSGHCASCAGERAIGGLPSLPPRPIALRGHSFARRYGGVLSACGYLGTWRRSAESCDLFAPSPDGCNVSCRRISTRGGQCQQLLRACGEVRPAARPARTGWCRRRDTTGAPNWRHTVTVLARPRRCAGSPRRSAPAGSSRRRCCRCRGCPRRTGPRRRSVHAACVRARRRRRRVGRACGRPDRAARCSFTNDLAVVRAPGHPSRQAANTGRCGV